MRRQPRIGLIGAAHLAHAISYGQCLQRAGAAVVGVYDPDPRLCQAVASQLVDVPVFTDQEVLICQQSLDAVVIAGATDQHIVSVRHAAAAGLHVLCEKPLATNLEDAQEIARVCDAAGVQLHVAFVCRFYPMVQEVRRVLLERLADPIVGMVGGNRGRPPLPPGYPSWITDPKHAGGGALLDHAVHVIDAMRYVSGAEVTRVRAEAGTLFSPGLAVDDAALLLLEFTNGMVASIDPSWSVPAGSRYHYDFYLRILTSSGYLDLDDRREALEVTSDHHAGRPTTLLPFGKSVDSRMIEHFLDCIVTHRFVQPAANGDDGVKAVEVALAAYESANLGISVELPSSPARGRL